MISEFFFQIAELKKLPRSGWKIKVGLENSESVAEHSYMMSVMSMVLSDMKSLDSEKVLKMAIVHDWAESKIGDFVRTFLENYKKEKKISILLASHNMNEVTRLCKKILMMKDGVIIDKGNPEELIKKHGRKNLEEVFLKLSRNKNEL